MLASWTYDTVKKGMITASSSYVGSVPGTPGAKYSNTVVSYDAGGNVTRSTVSIPSSAPAFGGTTYTTTAGYYPDSTLSVRNVPAIGGLPSEQILYSYDAWGRLGNVRGNGGILNSTIYSPTGQLAQFNRLNLGAEAYSSFGYDSVTGALLSIKDNAVFDGSGHYVADRVYTRDDAGNVTSSTISSVLPTVGTQKTCYSYDALRQLTQAWTPAAATACTVAPSQAGLTGIAPFWNEYGYDTQSGNRLSMTTRGPAGAAKSATLSYPAAGAVRPHAPTGVTGDPTLGAGGYGYDSAGNMTSRPGQTVTYNEIGKVATITAGAATQSNVYDASAMLLLRVNSIEGASLFLGDTVLTQAAGSSTVSGARTYAGAEGIPVAQRTAKTGTSGSTVSWLFTDLHGTVDTRTVASSGVTTRQYRDPFGVPIGGATGAWPDGSGFLSKPVTTSTGLTSIGARTYDPILGKFTSVDAVVASDNPQQNIGYGYSGNNPTTFSDPSGDCYNYKTDSLTLSTNCAGGKGVAKDDSETKRWRAANQAKNPVAAASSPTTPAAKPKSSPAKPDTDQSWVVAIGRKLTNAILPYTVITDELAKLDWYRTIANAPVSAVAGAYALANGGRCGVGPSMMLVCQVKQWNYGGGTTYGSTFITAGDLRKTIEDEQLMKHETAHSRQWAAQGAIPMAAGYGMSSGYSQLVTGTYGCANFYEWDAGLVGGGYGGCLN
ncbi:hypothetical protein KEC57_01330 [Microbacterium sp. BWT-G7]|uniref:RHS repeat-associated core domain-containing protein n=2 Tax=Microbacterium allomyrinae TaxID=2830666 RepID=A0A9X1LRY1_9MICO|nr:hypothetical protein [Microbacterium allomyrinae]